MLGFATDNASAKNESAIKVDHKERMIQEFVIILHHRRDEYHDMIKARQCASYNNAIPPFYLTSAKLHLRYQFDVREHRDSP
jgi:hypothetical protein